MTKQQLYESLVKSGVQLAPVDAYTFKQLAEIAAPYHKSKPAVPDPVSAPADPDPVKIPTLRFESSGWCPELCISYTQGFYTPRSRREYDILKKYATEHCR
ncbi:MAG: hypothetical protein E7055_01745 [Lentisphaerae bacterium]|nr:hypothetical protein [Lentisphaerota bacterium]